MLAKEEFIKLVLDTQERVTVIKKALEEAAQLQKIDHERQRKVDNLVNVERNTAGAAHTFAKHALGAIKKAGGDASKVDWAAVEKEAAMESITQHKQPPKNVFDAIARHSPGMADPARQDRIQALVSTLPETQIAAPKVTRRYRGPSLG